MIPLACAASSASAISIPSSNSFSISSGLPAMRCLSVWPSSTHDIGLAILLTNLMNRADVGVIQRRGCAGIALETIKRLAVLGELLGQEFQCDGPAEFCIFGLIHHTHPAATELFQDAIVGDRLAN